MKLLTYSVAATVALAGLTWHNTQLWRENRRLRTALVETSRVATEVGGTILTAIESDDSIPSESRERLASVVRHGFSRIDETIKESKPGPPHRLGLQSGYNGRHWAGGIDYQMVRRDIWSVNLGFAALSRGGGPTVGIYARPKRNWNLTTGVMVMYNLSDSRFQPYLGIRLPL